MPTIFCIVASTCAQCEDCVSLECVSVSQSSDWCRRYHHSSVGFEPLTGSDLRALCDRTQYREAVSLKQGEQRIKGNIGTVRPYNIVTMVTGDSDVRGDPETGYVASHISWHTGATQPGEIWPVIKTVIKYYYNQQSTDQAFLECQHNKVWFIHTNVYAEMTQILLSMMQLSSESPKSKSKVKSKS